MNKTNKELAKDMNCTLRQISKSRKRGYITNNNGERIKYKAPEPVFITLKATPKTQKWERELSKKIYDSMSVEERVKNYFDIDEVIKTNKDLAERIKI